MTTGGVLGSIVCRMPVMIRAGSTRMNHMKAQKRMVHKNQYLEEWTGIREAKYKSYKLDGSSVWTAVLYMVIFPAAVFMGSLAQEHAKGNRKDIRTIPDSS